MYIVGTALPGGPFFYLRDHPPCRICHFRFTPVCGNGAAAEQSHFLYLPPAAETPLSLPGGPFFNVGADIIRPLSLPLGGRGTALAVEGESIADRRGRRSLQSIIRNFHRRAGDDSLITQQPALKPPLTRGVPSLQGGGIFSANSNKLAPQDKYNFM